jgi:probable rRNA maturation factor
MTEIIVVNLQRKVPLEMRPLRTFAASLSAEIDEMGSSDFSVAFVSDGRMKELNSFFRGKETTTDVLSFRHEPDEFAPTGDQASGTIGGANADPLGDIVISVEQAQRQAEENGLDLETEIKQLILHGVLHLCGYDHETDGGEMNARELELRSQLDI